MYKVFLVLWVLCFAVFYEVRVLTNILVSPWALGVSFWKPGFFLAWVFLASFKRNGCSKPRAWVLMPCLLSLLVTLYPYFALDVSVSQKLLAFKDSALSIHSLIHSHTVKLPIGFVKDGLGIQAYADSGDPWRMVLPDWLIALYGCTVVVGILALLRLNLSSINLRLGGFGLALSFFDGGVLAPYAIAGLALIFLPSWVTISSFILWPGALYFDWLRQCLIFLLATQIVSNRKRLLSAILIIPLIANWTPWLLKPFISIPSKSYAVRYVNGEPRSEIIPKDTRFILEHKPYPPAWNLLEVDGITCDKNSGFSSKGELLAPRISSLVVESQWGNLRVDKGVYEGDFKGCVPNSFERTVIFLLKTAGISEGVLSN